jgi:NDP-sugar pyrophosphorylase family protein
MKPEIFEFVPDNEYFGMDTLIKKMLQIKSPISKYELKEYWLDIGRIDDFETAQTDFQNNFYKAAN